jgi:TolB-like protein
VISRLLLAALCLSSTAVLAQECVTCWNDQCADSASYLPRCAAPKTPPAAEHKPPATKSGHAEPPLLTSGKLAVLEFDDKLRGKDAHTDRTYFSDAVRAAAKRVSPGLFVMTRESVLSLLQSNGKKLEDCVGNCEVETGRLLGADYVVSGRLTKMGGRFVLTLRLHATRTGELLNTGRAQGRNVEELVDATDDAADSLLRKPASTPAETEEPSSRRKREQRKTPAPDSSKPAAPETSVAAPVTVEPPRAVASAPPQCTNGQSVGTETEGHCCWAGQVWAGSQCRGLPTSCPEGFRAEGENCALAACEEGRERVDATHCCWPSQVFSKGRGKCVGIPRCPRGMEASGESCGDASQKVEPKSGLAFIRLPAGSFHYGCEPQDSKCESDEKPGRTAAVRGFWLGKTDVTVSAYERCVNAGACTKPDTGSDACTYGRRADHPVNCVDWGQANAFCSWVGGRLPTAEEWEYAAKSGESRVYPWGDQEPNGQLANYGNTQKTTPAGAYPAGATKWGLLDMAGNVWQWTASDYDSSKKEVRGGGWSYRPRILRASLRYRDDPSWRGDFIGFRCGL